MNYYMISDYGETIMSYYQCETFPKCNPSIDDLDYLLNKTLKINMILFI